VIALRDDGDHPVWRIGNLAAPRIARRAVIGREGPAPARAPQVDPRPSLRGGVWLFLDAGSPVSIEQLQRPDRRQLRQMYAALMRDVQGASLDRIADQLGSAHPGLGEESSTRREVRTGRQLWRRLPAWPWSWFDADGRPPPDWLAAGPDPVIAAALATWATGKPVLAARPRALASHGARHDIG